MVKCEKTDFHSRLDWRESRKKENKSVQRLERQPICKKRGTELILVLPKENWVWSHNAWSKRAKVLKQHKTENRSEALWIQNLPQFPTRVMSSIMRGKGRRWEWELEIMVETKLKEFNALASEKLDDLIPAFWKKLAQKNGKTGASEGKQSAQIKSRLISLSQRHSGFKTDSEENRN